MKLQSVKVKGFRTFCNWVNVDFEDLTMLIGNNDVGKSSILDILELALDASKRPDPNKDFYTCEEGNNADEIVVLLNFSVNNAEKEAFDLAIKGVLSYKATYQSGNTERKMMALVPEHNELRCNFSKLSAGDQKTLIERFDPETSLPINNSQNRQEWFDDFIKTVN